MRLRILTCSAGGGVGSCSSCEDIPIPFLLIIRLARWLAAVKRGIKQSKRTNTPGRRAAAAAAAATADIYHGLDAAVLSELLLRLLRRGQLLPLQRNLAACRRKAGGVRGKRIYS